MLTRVTTLKVETPAPPVSVARWTRARVWMLLGGTAGFYLVNLKASGFANTFYSAAAQAGSKSWEAWFFGSADAGNSMTVDKPPAFLWLMGLSVRLFGLSPWSVLAPQVLLGVLTVGLVYAITVRRCGQGAGLAAGAVLALTPVAALMFRFDNPDAMLTFLLTAAAWALLRGIDTGQTRFLLLSGGLAGLGFLTKDLAVLLPLPGMALAYLLAGPVPPGRRWTQLVAAGGAMLITAGWWVAVVELWPAAHRPWIGGSTDNSFLSVVIGGNGLDRLWTSTSPSGFRRSTGWLRLFNGVDGGQISWLLPAAGLLLIAALLLLRAAPRTDPRRATLVLWAGWLGVSMVVYSLMAGIYHEYYTVAIAPPIAGIVGAAGSVLWERRAAGWVRAVLASSIVGTAGWSWVLLGRSPDFLPWLRWLILPAAALAGVLLLSPATRREQNTPLAASGRAGRIAVALMVTAISVAVLAGPAAYTAETISVGHTGAAPTAGPVLAGTGINVFGPGGALFIDRGLGGGGGMNGVPSQRPVSAAPRGDNVPFAATVAARFGSSDVAPRAGVAVLLDQDAAAYTWVAATTGAIGAASYQLATELPVLGIGGFNGAGVSPTLAEFRHYVADREVHYYLAAGVMVVSTNNRAATGGGPATQILRWVVGHFSGRVVDGITVYDLTAGPTG